MRLGTNVAHIDPIKAVSLGCKHLEISLLWEHSLDRAEVKTIEKIKAVDATGCNYSIHLPIFISTYPFHVFSAYFLDEDAAKREASFAMVELNLERLQVFRPQFYVVHFSGVYPMRDEALQQELLRGALVRLNEMAIKYNTQILLEYFGFNLSLLSPESWSPILEYSNLGILLDTGHMLFSARMHQIDFKDLFLDFYHMCSAIHLWNTGIDLGVYETSPSYMEFHHMVPRLTQTEELGYGVDMNWVAQQLGRKDIPLIIEASILHQGSGTLDEGIIEWSEWIEKTRGDV